MKIGIVGLGLIGGSIFKRAKLEGFDTIAVSFSQAPLNSNQQEELGIFNDYQRLKDCDIVFVCSTIEKTPQVLEELNTFLTKDNIVCDVASVKEFVTGKSYHFKFIPTHPMAGTENTGFENSCSDLFNNAKWVIIREDNEENDVNKVADFIKILGASPIFCNADEHDVAVALISHMPLLISQAIYLTAGNNELAKQLASSGFRDMTRLALSSPQMASDMLNFNGKYIKNALAGLGQNVEKLLDNDYFEYCEKIREERKKMYDINGKNVYIGEVKND